MAEQAEIKGYQMRLLLDSPLTGTVQNDMRMMVWSLFSLSKDPVTELPVYDDGKVRIAVRGTSAGVATMWDKELLIYAGSVIREKIERGEKPERRINFTANDFCRITGTKPCGKVYDRLEGGLARLQGTQIKTNLETGGSGEDGAFSWVTDYKVKYRRSRTGEKRMSHLTVEICEWLYRAIVHDASMLTYDPAYFYLPPLERRLYEIARAHCASGSPVRFNLEQLRQRVGSQGDLKRFRLNLARARPIPDYGIALVTPDPEPETSGAKRTARSLRSLSVVLYPLTMSSLFIPKESGTRLNESSLPFGCADGTPTIVEPMLPAASHDTEVAKPTHRSHITPSPKAGQRKRTVQTQGDAS